MEKTIAITSVIFSICMLIIGCYIYFIYRKKKWVQVNADILRIHIIKKLDEKNPKSTKSTISVKFGFKVGSVTYHPVFNDSILGIQNTDFRKDLVKNKKLIIYYDVRNPNISYVKIPNDGITIIFFSLILLIISTLYLQSIKKCKVGTI